jgi:hypothetical protein
MEFLKAQFQLQNLRLYLRARFCFWCILLSYILFPKIELGKIAGLPQHAYKYYSKNLLNVFDKLHYLGLKPNLKFCFERNELASLAEGD